MRSRFLLRYLFRTLLWFAIVISTRNLSALIDGFIDLKTFLLSALVLLLAAMLTLLYGISLDLATSLVQEIRGLSYESITKELIVNALMPSIRSFMIFMATVYAFRYIYSTELSHAYAFISLTTVATLVGVIAGNAFPYPPRLFVLVMLALISAVHTYYYATNMLSPYIERSRRISNVLQGRTHVPVMKLKRYVQEMRRKDPRFRSRLTLEEELKKIPRVALAAMIGSIASIALAVAAAYGAYFLSYMIFSESVYESIKNAVELKQPEIFLLFVSRLASGLYLYALRYSGILSTRRNE